MSRGLVVIFQDLGPKVGRRVRHFTPKRAWAFGIATVAVGAALFRGRTTADEGGIMNGGSPPITGALGRSGAGSSKRALLRSARMAKSTGSASPRAIDPLVAIEAVKEYFSETDYETRRRDFRSWEPELLRRIDTAENP